MTKHQVKQTWQNIRIPLGLVLFLFGGVVWAVNLRRDVADNSTRLSDQRKTITAIDTKLEEISERLGEIRGSLNIILKRRK